jgi:hypothetical protein
MSMAATSSRFADVIQEAVRVMPGTSHGESQNQRDEEDADGVIPVKQLEAVVLDALVSVGPGAPADGARDHHEKCNAESMRGEHAAPL